jgi:hypothetical protein
LPCSRYTLFFSGPNDGAVAVFRFVDRMAVITAVFVLNDEARVGQPAVHLGKCREVLDNTDIKDFRLSVLRRYLIASAAVVIACFR